MILLARAVMLAGRYSSQSECSPEIDRKYSTSGSTAAGTSSTSAVPSTCTHGHGSNDQYHP
jgi:hypothetical protein